MQRLNSTEIFFSNGILRAEIRKAFKQLGDLERLTNRVLSGTAIPRDLVSLRSTLQQLPGISNLLSNETNLGLLLKHFNLCSDALSLIETSITEDPPNTLQNPGVICPGYSAELDGILERSKNARNWIANLEPTERNRTGIRSLKVGFNKVFGYYIEVTQANVEMVPSGLHS